MKNVKIKSIKKIDRTDRYDLTVSATNNFFANNILIHNTSSILGKLLCKRPLNFVERVAKKCGLKIDDKQYDYIFASRKVIKNNELNPNANHFYSDNIWGIAAETLKPFIKDGMTLYFEIVGYMPGGGMIQKGYDYGCKEGEFKTAIYRITYTNPSGEVFEFSAKQVQDWCREMGVAPVRELFYGRAFDYLPYEFPVSSNKFKKNEIEYDDRDLNIWQNEFLQKLKADFNEKDCDLCSNPVPEEGCVIRVEGNNFEAYKCKSARFYEWETKMLDAGEADIESEGAEE